MCSLKFDEIVIQIEINTVNVALGEKRIACSKVKGVVHIKTSFNTRYTHSWFTHLNCTLKIIFSVLKFLNVQNLKASYMIYRIR